MLVLMAFPFLACSSSDSGTGGGTVDCNAYCKQCYANDTASCVTNCQAQLQKYPSCTSQAASEVSCEMTNNCDATKCATQGEAYNKCTAGSGGSGGSAGTGGGGGSGGGTLGDCDTTKLGACSPPSGTTCAGSDIKISCPDGYSCTAPCLSVCQAGGYTSFDHCGVDTTTNTQKCLCK